MPARRAGFALVHAPLVGPRCWLGVEEALRRSGARALAVDYGGVQGPDWYGGAAERIVAAIRHLPHPWVLAVHSGAGGLAPSIIAAAPAPPSAAVYVDAILPHPGQSWLQTAPPGPATRVRALAESGILPPWNRWFAADPAARLIADAELLAEFKAQLPRLPLEFLESSAPDRVTEPALPTGYLRLSEGYGREAAEARRRGWTVVEAPMHHLALLTDPARVAGMMMDLVADLPAK